MISRNILRGTIQQITSMDEAKSITAGSRVQYNYFTEPGKYMVLHYSQSCPRGCCYDDVTEITAINDILEELANKIPESLALDLAQMLIKRYSPEEEDFDDVQD